MRKALNTKQLKIIYSQIARRYDFQHGLITAKSDQRGRCMLVEHCVCSGDRILDAGAGTGSSGILAACKAGPSGSVTFFDLNEDMLAIAREKLACNHSGINALFETGDMCQLPFADNCFDVALSSYSLCPIYDPDLAVRELFRVVKPGGRLGFAYSTEASNDALRWLADIVENIAWRLPSLSMGCRAIDAIPAIRQAGGKIIMDQHIGIALWPFRVLVIETPQA